jgi:pilus assembly protein FimV
MGRKINAAVLGASFILPGVAGALGLGEITLNSGLNQPLNADIAIKKVGDLSTAEILTKLAPKKEFERSGVDRAYFLSDIQFDVKFAEDGGATIHLTTQKPVVEPFLNFILEVQWPQGKLLKEFTLLLDPPVLSQEFSQPITPPMSDVSTAQTGGSQGRTASVGDVERPVYPSNVSTQSDAASADSYGKDTYGPVARSEGLWEIAKKVRPNTSLTINQTMVALQQKNPNAFLRNNINLLKEGQVLRLPTAEEILRNSYQDAVNSVREQNQSWKQPSAQVAGEAVEPESESQLGGDVEQAPESEAIGDGRLTLVAAGSDAGDESTAALGATGGEMGEGAVSALQQELAVKGEVLDKTVIENENLKSQLDEINEQLETSAELVQLKDDQIATLQKQLAALEQKTKETSALSPSADKESANGLDNPLVLAGIGAAIVALIVGLMLARRKSSDNEADDLPEQEFEAESLAVDTGAGEKSSEAEGLAKLNEDELQSADESESNEDLNQDDSVKQELGDVIGEADIYIAYGRFSHAAELLKQGCDAEPDREDIRLKLLEVLAETGEVDEFAKHDAVLRSSSDESILHAADALYLKVYGEERSSEAETSLGDELPEETTFDAGDEYSEELGSEFELDFSASDDAESETNEVSLDVSEEGAAGTELLDEGLDLEDKLSTDLEFELPDSESNEDAGFSLDLDTGEDLEQEAGIEIAGSEDDTVVSLEEQADDNDLGGLELDGFGEDEALNDVATQSDTTLSDEGFDLDLDDIGELDLGDSESSEFDGDVELDLEGLADSLEEAGVDLSDVAEPLEDVSSEDTISLSESESFELPDSSDLDLSDSSMSEEASSDLSGDINLDEDDLDLLSDLDENATKLDLARAYLEMGDASGAKEILQEVLAEGNDTQKQDAEEMLGQIA